MHCTTRHHTATYCNTPLHVGARAAVRDVVATHPDTHYNTLLHTAPHGTTLHHTASQLSTLGHGLLCVTSLQEVYLRENTLQSTSALAALPNLAHVAVDVNRLTRLDGFSGNSSLRTLGMQMSHVTHVDESCHTCG